MRTVDPTSDAAAAAVPLQMRTPPAPVAVLLVEDDQINQMVAAAFLQSLGFTDVRTADNGREALALCAANDFQLVLMDCLMPEMDGLEATRRLRASGFDKPVIALTAGTDQDDIERCLAAGMNDHLPKPIDLPRMAAALTRWAGRGAPTALN
ncbi:MAG: response regulator [Ramlibacter sp.]